MILKAQRPVIFIGHGVTLSEASRELTEFASKLGIPVISSPNGMGCFDMTRPAVARLHRPQRRFPANEAGRRADLVDRRSARASTIARHRHGCPAIRGISRTTKLIHVDVDPAEIGRNYPPDLGILADARTFLRQLLAELERRSAKSGNTKAWLADIAELAGRMGQIHQAEFRPARFADPARAHRR